jgi:hypothetical protein
VINFEKYKKPKRNNRIRKKLQIREKIIPDASTHMGGATAWCNAQNKEKSQIIEKRKYLMRQPI